MADADVYSLFSGDEASAQEQAMALANALRQRQQQAAQLRGLALGTSLGENPMLAGLNRSATQAADALSGEAGQQQGLLAQAGGQRAGHALQRAMQAQSQRFQAGQGALDRAAQGQVAGARLAIEQARAQREAEKAGREVGTGLRKEFHLLPQVKEFNDINAAFESLKVAAENPSGAGGVATIFSFMKLLDPGVAVMEGDVERIRAAGGPAAKYAHLYEAALTGNPLPPQVRADIVEAASQLYQTRLGQYQQLAERYRGLAQKANASPDDVVPAVGAQRGPTQGGSFSLEAPPARVQVSNGKETLDIDAADLAAAEADGYRRVR